MRTLPNALLVFLLLVAVAAERADAQFGRGRKPGGPQPGQQLTQRWQVGVIVRATGGPCKGLYGTAPIPTEWPEQQVRVVEEDVSPFVRRFEYHDLIGVRQVRFSIPQLPAGETAIALVTLEITREASQAPTDTSRFVVPKRAPRDVALYLGGSPSIETRHPSIRSQAHDITGDTQGGWKQVELIFDWVRDNIKYQNGSFQGAVGALREGHGNKEDLTSLFIALCRAEGIPARTVWVPDHSYPEFYLQDEKGEGSWFPCQVAGPREFGGISDHRPILQKGENIKVPEKKDRQRFVAEYLKGSGGQPRVEFVRKLLPAG